jgi:hypothetical protein
MCCCVLLIPLLLPFYLGVVQINKNGNGLALCLGANGRCQAGLEQDVVRVDKLMYVRRRSRVVRRVRAREEPTPGAA